MDSLRDRQSELIKTINAINELLKNKDWRTFEELVLEKRWATLERLLLAEAKTREPSLAEIYRLQGRWDEAKKLDLVNYAEVLIKELEGIKIKLQNGSTT